MNTPDTAFLSRTLHLAARAEGLVAPNPMVGCVIVGPDGQIFSEGYHKKFGGPHAEVEALKALPAGTDLAGSTVYVSLEPCAHHGKTPPCADALIAAGVHRVVAATLDPNPLVAGQGFAKLRAAGIEVQEGPLKAEALTQNRRFITPHWLGRPFITLKWAQTGDGFIARPDYTSQWITAEEARAQAHRARAKHQAIVVGYRTALHDNPSLTTRLWQGPSPLRIVVDPKGALPENLTAFTDGQPTWQLIYGQADSAIPEKVGYQKIYLNQDLPLAQTIAYLCQKAGIQSLLVEGGAGLLGQFFEENLWDEALVFSAPGVLFGTGITAPALPAGLVLEERSLGPDRLLRQANSQAGFWQALAQQAGPEAFAPFGRIPGAF